MLLQGDHWDLEQLSLNSGVSVRSIRFYQQAGLLPSPRTPGRTAYYGEADARRLQLIRTLQRQRRMPLGQIRLELPSPGDDAAVRRLLEDLAQEDQTSSTDYARSIRLRSEHIVRQEPAAYDQAKLIMARHRPAAPRQARWERISLTPEIEIHVREGLSYRQNRLLHELLTKAQELLHSEEDV